MFIRLATGCVRVVRQGVVVNLKMDAYNRKIQLYARKLRSCSIYKTGHQCDQIGRIIGLWATF